MDGTLPSKGVNKSELPPRAEGWIQLCPGMCRSGAPKYSPQMQSPIYIWENIRRAPINHTANLRCDMYMFDFPHMSRTKGKAAPSRFSSKQNFSKTDYRKKKESETKSTQLT